MDGALLLETLGPGYTEVSEMFASVSARCEVPDEMDEQVSTSKRSADAMGSRRSKLSKKAQLHAEQFRQRAIEDLTNKELALARDGYHGGGDVWGLYDDGVM